MQNRHQMTARCRICAPSHFTFYAAVMVDSTPRFFLCARCFAQVLICRSCDRGQRYCAGACSSAARRERQREAAQRYQSSDGGRAVHAGRSRRWRLARREDAGDSGRVTHQGQPQAAAPASAMPTRQQGDASTRTLGRLSRPCCEWCSLPLVHWVRQGFLRRPTQPRERLGGGIVRPQGP